MTLKVKEILSNRQLAMTFETLVVALGSRMGVFTLFLKACIGLSDTIRSLSQGLNIERHGRINIS